MEEITLSDINLLDIGNTIQIGGVILTGNNESYVLQLPNRSEEYPNLKKLVMSLADWETLLKQMDLVETEIFVKDETGLTKKIVRKTQRAIDSYIQWAVFARDKYVCRYCGRTEIPLTVDHIDLWEVGGPTIVENLISACRNCNKDRGRMTYEDWLASKTYQKRSQGLSDAQKEANEAVLRQLGELRMMRFVSKRSR